MTLDLRQLRHLLAVAENGSLGRAAAALGVTQPALTRSLQSLERDVGELLFVRSKSGVEPTDRGRLMIARAGELVRAADDLDREVQLARAPGSGLVAFGAGVYPAETIVPDALARFVETNPRLQVRVIVRAWDDLIRMLRAREIDFFVAETSTLEGQHDLDVEPLDPHPVYFVARKGHPLAHRTSFRFADTFGYPILALTRIPPRLLRPLLEERSRIGRREARAFPAVEIGSVSAARRVVASSDAIAPLTLPLVGDDLRDGRMVVLGTRPWLHIAYGIVSLKGRVPGEAALGLRDALRASEAALSRAESRLVDRVADGARVPERRR